MSLLARKVVVELLGGVYDGAEFEVHPQAVAHCPACDAHHDFEIPLPPVVKCPLSPVRVWIATIPDRGPHPGAEVALYRHLEDRPTENRVLYCYRGRAMHDPSAVRP